MTGTEIGIVVAASLSLLLAGTLVGILISDWRDRDG